MRKIWLFAALVGLGLGTMPGAQAQQPAPARNVIVTMPGNVFTPRMLVIRAGESVTWMNGGGFHNVNADDGSFRCSNGCDQTGGNGDPSANPWQFTLKFDTPGVVPFFCEVHGEPGGRGMSGMVIVQ